MLGNPISQAMSRNQAQVLAQIYLDQARQQKTAKSFEVSLALYDQAKVTFMHVANGRQLMPSLSEVKDALIEAMTPKTQEEVLLHRRIAEVYFERAELLEKLGKAAKAEASYRKAQAWGYDASKLAPVPPESLPARGVSALAQTVASASMQRLSATSLQEKSELVDYLFEKALLTLNTLEVSNKPSLFLVYAHDNDAHGEAKASTSKYLINNLSKIRGVTLYSDQTPIGQAYSSSVESLEADGKLEDILTNQLCLLPAQLRADVEPVNKVIVCCSDVLGSYLKGQSYKEFRDELKKAYDEDREVYLKDDKQKGTPALREVVRKFSQEEKYKLEFHHVLTEMAFLEIRAAHLEGQHGIIPVSLTANSYDYCLKEFIESTTVRMEDPLRFDLQAKKGEEVYLNQGSHGVLFKVIERLLVGSDEAKTFLSKFWDGHSNFISCLKSDSKFGRLEFAKLLDGIFDGIRTTLHSQLASTMQQQHQQLRLLNADPRAALKEQYFAALKQDEAFNETLQLYVEPQGKASLQGVATGLLAQVEGLLKDKRVILLKGDSGSGKTTFSRVLEKHLWENRKEADEAIPLFISLASIDKPEHDLIGKALKKRGLSEYQIEKLKKKHKFVFILDGYDEIRQTRNLYLSNEINRAGNWQGQMLISCGSEYLGGEYGKRFQPKPRLKGEDVLFQEVKIEPFSEAKRNQYLEKYVQHNATGWTAQRYQFALKQEHLKELASTPFLLRVVLEALPYLENELKERSAVQLRLDLYDQFFRQWFDRNQQWLSAQNLTGAKRELFRELCDDDFAEHGIGFVQELAVHLYTENGGNPVVEYSLRQDKGNWKGSFFGREDEKQLLREAWPLIRSGNQYRFIHKSLLEYCAVRTLFDSFDACIEPESRSRRGSDASVYSFEKQAVVPRRTLVGLSLSPKHWVGDQGVVGLLTDRVAQETAFKAQLLRIVERSKTDGELRQAAANAITILVRAEVPFTGADLKGIQIPGADLSGGEFNGAQLEGADLRKVNLRNIKQEGVNLSGVKMSGVQYGDWSYLEEESNVDSISNWEVIRTLDGHTGDVTSVVYSPSGSQLASGSWDNTVRLWEAESGVLVHTLEGHTNRVYSVAYSPSGDQLASGSRDNTVRVWDANTGASHHTLRGHTAYVWSVAYSPSGDQLASGSDDQTVRVWDANTGEARYILSGHTSWVFIIAYSPSGDQLASSSGDHTVRVWDANRGKARYTLNGHTNRVYSVAYSPSGDQLASGGRDNTVRVWDANTGEARYTLSGHTSWVLSVAYSPSGDQLASGSDDQTVRVWDANTGEVRHTLSGHTGEINSVAYSPSGDQLASGSGDKTVRVWDVASE
ncbi:NACHT domain-containing protein [Mycoavidus sp. HKI]|uniref:NACHT and WD40 repeat domain-containing protein n=1 Tax=Mycoavidus sp. HKI TaxID=2840467 RepID=UPI001CBBDB31|nr:NACHT domain-containing protein [Mycoavidus sp. HKI]UAW63871.1 NACHT domain-containing protein [Mycoavidus sp. HKI]